MNDAFTWTNGGGWQDGTGETIFPVGATLLMTGNGGSRELRRVLRHQSQTGLSEWTGGWWYLHDGGNFINDTGALLRIDAGAGETVLILDEGSSARQMLGDPDAPIRAIVAGIVDEVDLATTPVQP